MLSASIINVIEDGYEKDKRLLSFYENSIKGLPDGSISIKKNNKKEYCYLNKRNGNKIISTYYSNNIESINDLRNKIAERNRYKKQIKMLKSEIKDLVKILEKYNSEKIRERRRVLEFS